MKTMVLKTQDIYRGDLILVNHVHQYQELHHDLCSVGVWQGTDILYERTAADALKKLLQEIGGSGQIVPVSAWRSMEEQQKIWDDSLAENGPEFTRNYVAVPGHSEHQTGLAIDLALKQPEIDFIRPYFPYEGICQKFREKAADYGFIERYQEDKQAVTGIEHEPWHFRYVGTPHAAIMTRMGIVLEEYIVFIKDYCYGENPYLAETKQGERYAVSFVRADSADAGQTAEIMIDETRQYQISGNNCDGFIVAQFGGYTGSQKDGPFGIG